MKDAPSDLELPASSAGNTTATLSRKSGCCHGSRTFPRSGLVFPGLATQLAVVNSTPPEARHTKPQSVARPAKSSNLAEEIQTDVVRLERSGTTSQLLLQTPVPQLSDFREHVAEKLRTFGEWQLADKLDHCGSLWSVSSCNGCGKVKRFANRCDLFWCPSCAPHLSKRRRKAVEGWALMVRQPKHVVLTCSNLRYLTLASVRRFKQAFSRLRRSEFAKGWRGGCYTLEVTNESRGWHLHLHALIDADWIDKFTLAKTWARLIGQEFSIVHVRDCREREYLAEVTKYVVKGSEMIKWSGHELVEFINAFTGVRTFGAFGSLFKLRAAYAAWLECNAEPEFRCECGCTQFTIQSESEYEWSKLTHDPPQHPRSPLPEFDPQIAFSL